MMDKDLQAVVPPEGVLQLEWAAAAAGPEPASAALQQEREELVTGAVRESTDRLLEKTGQKSGRVIADGDLGSIFGIELAEDVVDYPGIRNKAHGVYVGA